MQLLLVPAAVISMRGNIGNAQAKDQEIQQAYQNCVDCMLQSEQHEKEDTVTEITVIYNGKIHEFLPEKQLAEFFKTI